MPDAYTDFLNLTKPEIGASRDVWGSKWNENADKIDGKVKEVFAGIGSAVSLCEVVWLSATKCRLQGKDGNSVVIDGRSRTIPVPGVEFDFTTGAGVVAGNNFLVAFMDMSDAANPKIAMKAVQTTRTVHSTLRYATCGVDAETLVAGFYAQGDRTVLYTAADKHLASWCGARNRSLYGAVASGQTGSQSYVEANATARVSAFMWGDRPVIGFGRGSMPSNTYGALYTAISLDLGTGPDQIQEVYGTPSGYNPSGINPATPSGPLEPKTDGLHFVTGMLKTTFTGIQQWNDIRISAVVNM